MELVIAEKPSVGITLAKALGVTDRRTDTSRAKQIQRQIFVHFYS